MNSRTEKLVSDLTAKLGRIEAAYKERYAANDERLGDQWFGMAVAYTIAIQMITVASTALATDEEEAS